MVPWLPIVLSMSAKLSRNRASRESGYVLFTMAAAMIVIVGFAGLVVDVGYSEYIHRQTQAAADAGAKAAALEIMSNHTTSITAAAKQDTANNGFTDGVGGVTVTVNHPPLSGSYATKNGYAEVIVSKTISTSFMSILGFANMTITARGVGGGGPGGACIYALNPTVQDAMLASGSASVNAGCGVMVESSNAKGLEVSGGACITGSSIQTVGNYNGSCFTPTPTTGVTSPGDPLTGKYPRPTPGSCTATNWNNGGTSISPGTYCGGIVVSGTTVTASPGTYILNGGGLTVSGGGNLTGSGVTFINLDSGGSYGGYKPIVVSGGSATQLSAPISGTYEGLLFYQDPSLSSTNYNKQNTVSGGSSTKFEGTLYFPNSPLYYSGGSSNSSAYTIIVADIINFSGPSTLNADYSSLSSGSPIKTTAILAE